MIFIIMTLVTSYSPSSINQVNTNVSESARYLPPFVSSQIHVNVVVSVDSPHLRSNRDVYQISSNSSPALA